METREISSTLDPSHRLVSASHQPLTLHIPGLILFTHAFLPTPSDSHKVCSLEIHTWGGPSYELDEEVPGPMAKGSSGSGHLWPG